MLTSWISVIAQAAPAPADHSALWTILLTQAVTLGLFYWALREARRKDRKARKAERRKDQKALENHRENERETLRLNLKREVFLEVAPAIQNNYLALAAFVDLQLSIHDLQENTRNTLAQSGGAIAKLQAVAADETLEAARQVQTLLGTIYIRLIAARGALEERNDLDAIREIARLWRNEVAAFPPLISSLIEHVRQELHLPFDRERFVAGVVDSNSRMFAELEKIMGPLG
ncbi:hypothetical protein ACFPPA_03305 [Rhodanobacter ginsengisoli]|uniref:LemA family protein n=1 Tax=Rhodanobacter ginsengisoli TaxID=418646 RepID=A0ABW0QME2_9GAMM